MSCVWGLVVFALLAAATIPLARRGEPDLVFGRAGQPRPATSGPASLGILVGTVLALTLAVLLALPADPLTGAGAVAAIAAGGLAAVFGGGAIAVAVLDLADPNTVPLNGAATRRRPWWPGSWIATGVPSQPPSQPPTPPRASTSPPLPLSPPSPSPPPSPPSPSPASGSTGRRRAAPPGPAATTAPQPPAPEAPPAPSASASPAGPADPRLLRGGFWIGILERGAVMGAVLSGYPEGLALLLVVKGFGRYPELHNPPAAERFIIGSLVSILWACACAGVTIALIK
jgi:hypothetical protein